MKANRKYLLYPIGGAAYVAAELLYRGRSHITMFAAGGICLRLLSALEDEPLRPAQRVLLGAAAITAVELMIGLAFNRDYRIWDYRDRPGNLMGQICPEFCLIWLVLAWAGGKLSRWVTAS